MPLLLLIEIWTFLPKNDGVQIIVLPFKDFVFQSYCCELHYSCLHSSV